MTVYFYDFENPKADKINLDDVLMVGLPMDYSKTKPDFRRVLSVKGYDNHVCACFKPEDQFEFSETLNDQFFDHNDTVKIRKGSIEKVEDKGFYYRFYVKGSCNPYDLYPYHRREQIQERFAVCKAQDETLPEPVK